MTITEVDTRWNQSRDAEAGTMRERTQDAFRKSIRIARARYALNDRWAGTVRIAEQDPARLKPLLRQPN